MTRRPRSRQLVFTFTLCLPLIVAALTSQPFVSKPAATAANRMLGPNFPALIDTNGDGRPSPGVDTGIVQTVSGTGLTIETPWHCNRSSKSNDFTLMSPDGQGRYQTGSRTGAGGITQ